MNLKRNDVDRFRGGARDKLNAVALRGAFVLGAIVWAVTGEFLFGAFAIVLAAAASFVAGELR